MNDETPQFEDSLFVTRDGARRTEAEIAENSPANTPIVTVRAFDKDIGENARVEYLLEDSQGGLFSVGRIDGVLRLSRSVLCCCFTFFTGFQQPVNRS